MIFYFLRRPKTSVLFALALVALAVFGFSLKFGFVLDDESQIVNNFNIHSLSNILGAFSGSTMDSLGAKRMAGIYYKPIMTVSYILLWAISKEAWIFHLFQLLLHVLNAFLIFMLFGKIGKFSKNPPGPLFCFILALGFLVHPINVETVVYIADLQDVLFSFFGLLALNGLATYQGSILKGALCLGALLELSLLSKESGVLYLLITGLFCFFFEKEKTKLWAWAASGAAGVYLGLRVGVAQLIHGSNSSQMLRADIVDRVISMPKIFFHYMVTFLFPKDITLVQDWVVKDLSLSEFWLPLFAVVGLTVAAFHLLGRTRNRVLLFFLCWFILGMGVHSNLVPLDGSVADRWFYFPMVGLLGVLGFYFYDNYADGSWVGFNGKHRSNFGKKSKAVNQGRIARNYGILFFVVSLTLLGWSARSFARTLDWETGLLLFKHDLALMPDNFYLVNNVGVELFRVGKTPEALEYFRRSTELFPGWTTSWTNLGSAHQKLGNHQEAEKCFLRSVENGTSAMGYQNYAISLLQLGKKSELKAFLEQKALVVFPDHPMFKDLYAEFTR